MAKSGIEGGVIKYVFVSIILIAVMGYVTTILVTALENENNDPLGVNAGIRQYGPMIVTILFVSLLVVVIAGILRYLGAI